MNYLFAGILRLSATLLSSLILITRSIVSLLASHSALCRTEKLVEVMKTVIDWEVYVNDDLFCQSWDWEVWKKVAYNSKASLTSALNSGNNSVLDCLNMKYYQTCLARAPLLHPMFRVICRWMFFINNVIGFPIHHKSGSMVRHSTILWRIMMGSWGHILKESVEEKNYVGETL